MRKFKFSGVVRRSLLAAVLVGAGAPAVSMAGPVDGLKDWLSQPRDKRADLSGQSFATEKLSKPDADSAQKMLWDDHVAEIKETRQKEWDDKAITIGEHTLKLLEKNFGTKPANGWKLFISMHGGGGAPKALNDSQWENQIKLYQPDDSLYVAPRAPTDNWNLWHEGHIDGLFDRLVEDAIVLGDVDPNKVYIMGYSAGGDGVYQLGPRMADRWAAASMMAGHPNDASPLSLRNLPFTIHVGALDGGAQGYHRNEKATEWKGKLDLLQEADPSGYVHEVQLHEGRPHWMNLEDAVAVDWMAKYTRNPIPDKVVWHQSNVTHDRFYWLAMPASEAKGGQDVVVSRDGQTITIEKATGMKTLSFLLSDAMLDLDKPVVVKMKEKELFNGVVPRKIENLKQTLAERGDPASVYCGKITVKVAE